MNYTHEDMRRLINKRATRVRVEIWLGIFVSITKFEAINLISRLETISVLPRLDCTEVSPDAYFLTIRLGEAGIFINQMNQQAQLNDI